MFGRRERETEDDPRSERGCAASRRETVDRLTARLNSMLGSTAGASVHCMGSDGLDLDMIIVGVDPRTLTDEIARTIVSSGLTPINAFIRDDVMFVAYMSANIGAGPLETYLIDLADSYAFTRALQPTVVPLRFADFSEELRRKGGSGFDLIYYLCKFVNKAEAHTASRVERIHRVFEGAGPSAPELLQRLFGERIGTEWTQALSRPEAAGLSRLARATRRSLVLRESVLHPLRTFRASLRTRVDTLRRLWGAPGVSVVILGPDGVGKSTVAANLAAHLSGVFPVSVFGHWAPGMFRRPGTGRPVTQPHRKPPRSMLASVLKLAYLWFDFTVGYFLKIQLPVARSRLVIYDRYLLDLLVDSRRYRYSGPKWLAALVWRLVPKPDLVILLDAPAGTVQARASEVSFEETARQRAAYRNLVSGLGNGRIVDATQSEQHTAEEVVRTVLDFMADRTSRRLGLK